MAQDNTLLPCEEGITQRDRFAATARQGNEIPVPKPTRQFKKISLVTEGRGGRPLPGMLMPQGNVPQAAREFQFLLVKHIVKSSGSARPSVKPVQHHETGH